MKILKRIRLLFTPKPIRDAMRQNAALLIKNRSLLEERDRLLSTIDELVKTKKRGRGRPRKINK
jgi:hypothetical protein